MATSSNCPKCGYNSYEQATELPKNCNYKLSFIRCSSCGTVVGVTEYYNIGALLYKLAEKLRIRLD